MMKRFWYWWDYQSRATKLCVVLGPPILVLLLLPYIVGYALPFLAISGLLGFAFVRGCRVSKDERSYGRVALFIPLALVLSLGALQLMEPQPGPAQAASKSGKVAAKTTPSDHYADAFHELYSYWVSALRTAPLDGA